jgi:predicted ATPase
MSSRVFAAFGLWCLGYPDQALKRSHEAFTLAQDLSHPLTLATALGFTARLHQLRRELRTTQERAEAAIALASEQGFPYWVADRTILRGWAVAAQGQREEGLAQIRRGMAATRATGAGAWRPYFLALVVETYQGLDQAEEGLAVLAEALATVDKTGERFYEAELYRLKGELTLYTVQRSRFKVQRSGGGS